jgi:hypothetical protein
MELSHRKQCLSWYLKRKAKDRTFHAKKKKYAQKHCGRVRRRDQKKAEIENTRRKKMMGGEVGSTKDLVGNAHH